MERSDRKKNGTQNQIKRGVTRIKMGKAVRIEKENADRKWKEDSDEDGKQRNREWEATLEVKNGKPQ